MANLSVRDCLGNLKSSICHGRFIIPSKLWLRVVRETEDLLRKLADRRTQDYKECISVKKVMLKQEETFRHQVQELHRVYRIQKLLMRDAEANCKILRQTDRTSSSKGTPEHYEENSGLELTLATGSSSSRWKMRNGPYNSHSGSNFSSTSGESAGRKLKNSDWVVPRDFERFESKRKSADLKIENMRQHELKQPSWLFLCNKQHSLVNSLQL